MNFDDLDLTEQWYPVRVGASGDATNAEEAARLWLLSEEVTGARYSAPPINAAT